MDFDFNSNEKYSQRYQVAFTPKEAEAFSAAYSEHVHELNTRGNSGSISEFDTCVASWCCDSPHTIFINSVAPINEVLNAFHERTVEIVAELPNITNIPAFKNKDIGLRHSLGQLAQRLTIELSDKQATMETTQDITDLPEMHERH